jgi:hypothetical protein
MAQARRRARFVQEATHQLAVVRVLGQEHLDGGAATQHRVLGKVDCAHSALPDPANHTIIGDELADQRVRPIPLAAT